MIWAPPRMFSVETPAAVAVDLGCRYSLKVDDAASPLARHVGMGGVRAERARILGSGRSRMRHAAREAGRHSLLRGCVRDVSHGTGKIRFRPMTRQRSTPCWQRPASRRHDTVASAAESSRRRARPGLRPLGSTGAAPCKTSPARRSWGRSTGAGSLVGSTRPSESSFWRMWKGASPFQGNSGSEGKFAVRRRKRLAEAPAPLNRNRVGADLVFLHFDAEAWSVRHRDRGS